MNRVFAAAVVALVVSGSIPAAAQTGTTPAAQPAAKTAATTGDWYAAGATGVAGASKVGAVVSGEVGKRVWHNVDATIEVGWFDNVTTKDSTNSASTLTNYLAQTTGQQASSTVKTSAVFGTINARYPFGGGRKYQPYAIAGFGGARLAPKTTFSLGGTDVTGSIANYGVTLGADLAGSTWAPALNVGAGVTMPFGIWKLDVGYRFTPIFAKDNSTLVSRLFAGIGRRF